MQSIMNLFIIIVLSMIVCCNAQDRTTTKTLQVLEAILNETRATRELQYLSLQKSMAQERALNNLIEKVELLESRIAANKIEYTQPIVSVSFASCEDIKTMSPSAPSGYYNIITERDGTTQYVYCDMEHKEPVSFCNSIGWTRVAYLNMSNTSQECPAELREYNESGVRACGRQNSSYGSCDSVIFSTNGISYSEIRGRVIGYQWGSPDAFGAGNDPIDTYYVDGISITHGSPRQHIWTLVGSYEENGIGSNFCPCNNGNAVSVPLFVGNDYFCESGNQSPQMLDALQMLDAPRMYSTDPLWDGKECRGGESLCCNAPGMPWFHKVLDSVTSDNIELRVCGDARTTDEDTPVNLYEICIK